MDRAALDEITACLERDRTIFYYFRDRYALLLLQWAVGEGRSVRELRASPFARLLTKPTVRNWLGRQGKSCLKSQEVASVWENPALAYRLTLGRWPLEKERWNRYYHQMTRRGHNLVLQLNCPVSHIRGLLKIVGEEARDEIGGLHPVADGNEWTLAWARLDIDMETGEALIEEIQSDWIRDVHFNEELGRKYGGDYKEWIKYAERFLKPHLKVWHEAMLSATLWLLRNEIGIRRVFYHTYETGRRLKRLRYSTPPRSLYTDLPRKFCFQRTHNGPLFLRDDRCRTVRRRVHDPATEWFVLQLPAA